MHSDDTAPDALDVLARLQAAADDVLARALVGLGWPGAEVLGVDRAAIEDVARNLGRHHDLACSLWDLGLRETRLLAVRVEDPRAADAAQLDRWVHDVTHHELADYLAEHLLTKAPAARGMVASWSADDQPLVRAIGFQLLMRLNLDDEELAPGARYPGYFPVSSMSGEPVGAPAGTASRLWRAVIRYLGRRNRRTSQRAIRRAREAQLMWELDRIERGGRGGTPPRPPEDS